MEEITTKRFLVVLAIGQDIGPGVVPVVKWDWAGNTKPGETWELLGCGLMIPMPASQVIEAAVKNEAPASLPAAFPDSQEVTLSDFPAKADSAVIANYADPADYLARTGKRFRMTKEQKDRSLSRDEAFAEFVAGL